MRISAGELDRRILIFRADDVDNGTATVAGDPVFLGKRWAKKTDIRDGERLAAGENGADLASRFLVRSDSLTRTLGGKELIQYKDRFYHVVGVKESGDREDGIEITTSTRTDQA